MSGGIAPVIFNLGTTWRWVVSFTIRPLYPHGQSQRNRMDWSMVGPQSRSVCGGREKNTCPDWNHTPTVQPL